MMKKITILVNLFLISQMQLIVAPAEALISDESLYYNHLGDDSVWVKTSLEKSEEISILLSEGDVLTVLDESLGQDGQRWLRLGLDRKSSLVFDQDEVVDFWVPSDRFFELNLVEEILGRMTYCYRYVKRYLLKKGFVDTYLPGASAYMAATILPKHGFKKVDRKPTKAAHYDVCVYRGGPSGHGHIEVLDPQGWYYGYGYKKRPIQNRTFTGCFSK